MQIVNEEKSLCQHFLCLNEMVNVRSGKGGGPGMVEDAIAVRRAFEERMTGNASATRK